MRHNVLVMGENPEDQLSPHKPRGIGTHSATDGLDSSNSRQRKPKIISVYGIHDATNN